jgi:proteasome accessory factor A
MFDRLVGLETEYVLRFHPRERQGRRISNAELFARLLVHLQARFPLATAIVGENSWFLVNGGGLRFECLPFYNLLPASGFVEGATPECQGPKDVLRYQRAQDVLLSRQAAASGWADGDVALLKTSHDGHGHFFGCHENYEATIGSGRELLVWRVGLALALPLLFLLFVFADVVALTLVALFSVFARRLCRLTGREPGRHYAACVAWLVCLCRAPAQFVGASFVAHTAFCRLRERLLPFLITRTIISGAGMVCPDGRLVLSPRARGLRSLCGLTAAGWRSVFYFCQILKGINESQLGDWPSFARLFHRRQRLQLTIGDSNMAQVAEYLKIGTTLLVLDAIEAGELVNVPRLRRPLRALRAISADPDLRTTVPLADGTRASALEIQRFYLNACRRFLHRCDTVKAEAHEVIELWEETLDALEDNPARLVGKLDWVTKKYLIDSAGPDASIEEKRKLDMRYHELSRDGYYLRLEAVGAAPTMVEPADVLAAMHSPPEGTPAAVRGRLIRKFAGSSPPVRASWSSVIVPAESGIRVIRLSRS